MSNIAHNLARVQERIRRACLEYQQPAPLLLAVSKTRTVAQMRQMHQLGVVDFGENYLQEALDKQQQLADLAIHWHFIGPIQSNKARQIAEHFHWVHSVDRDKVARKLSQYCPDDRVINICIQVNVDGAATKSGVSPAQALQLLELCANLPHLKVRGFMAIPDPASDFEAQLKPLRQLARLLDEAQARFPDLQLDTLSMGMSGDMEAAIAAGSTLLRIGTDLFGVRS